MKRIHLISLVLAVGLAATFSLSFGKKPADPAAALPSVSARSDRGRYLIRIGGCNDCHTPGFMEKGWGVPESEWLTGVPLGWRGPWGTSYASNLRLALRPYTAPQWIEMVRSRHGLPPMPWSSLHAMTDEDLTAIHAYVTSLEPVGHAMPAPVPPGQEPKTPYLLMAPVTPQAGL